MSAKLRRSEFRRAVSNYAWNGATCGFQWAEEKEFLRVEAYLTRWSDGSDWKSIVDGGMAGYSLFLHEWVELRGYDAIKADPLILEEQVKNYRPMHAAALLAEHLLLQVVALRMGCSFSLRELVTYNPHGDEAAAGFEGDWDILCQYHEESLSAADKASPRRGSAKVKEFYKKLGFRRVGR